jgi:hypothetical protein
MKTLKKYTTPKMEILNMAGQNELLSASCESNNFWKCPEPEEGCDNPWWYDKE